MPGETLTQQPADHAVTSLAASAESLVRQRRFAEADQVYAALLARQPDDVRTLVNAGGVMNELCRFEDARVLLLQALALDPQRVSAWSNLASAMLELRRYDDAVAAYSNALKINAVHPPALSGLGVVLRRRGLPAQSLTFFDMALALDPNDAETRHCRALALLASGDIERGFAEYEWRWLTRGKADHVVDGPRWTGEALDGRTLLVHEDGGLGDIIQFARYLPKLASRGGRIILRAPAPLLPLLSRLEGVDAVTPTGADKPPHDLVCPIMSLPLIFGTTLATIPSPGSYLTPDPARLAAWRARLAADVRHRARPPSLRVGLVWAGGARPWHREATLWDRQRSTDLATFDPFADLSPDILFYSLQLGEAARQAADPPPAMRLVDHTALIRDFDDTAALVSLLDLIVSVDTSTAHLAGALGRPVWLLSCYERCWRWLTDRDDSPWYDSLRLYAQPAPGDWTTPVARMQAELRHLAERRPASTPAEPVSPQAVASARAPRAAARVPHQARRHPPAARGYVHALERDPSLVEAHNNLGNALRQLGKLDHAKSRFEKAIEISPDFAAPHYNLGSLLADVGNLDQAVNCLARAVKLAPLFTDAHFNLANVLVRLKRHDDAIAAFRQVLRIDPAYAEAHNNLGHALMQVGQVDQAIACFAEALLHKPTYAEAHVNQGCALLDRHELDEAIACFGKAVAIDPDFPQAHNNLGTALQEQGRLQEASVAFAHAIQLKPDYATAYINLGDTLRQLKQFDHSETCLRRAVELEPDNAHAHTGLGTVRAEQGRLDLAIASYRKALALDPAKTEAHNDLGNALKDQGRLAEALEHYTKALQLRPDYRVAFSNRLFTLNYLQSQSAEAACAEARRYGALVSPRVPGPFTDWRARPSGGPLRVGLVSSDLRNHPVGYFLESLLAAIDPARLTLLAFPAQKTEDDLTARIKPHFAAWTPLVGLSDEAAARLIHALGVDVLIDLSGHTANNRLPIFAWRPAPIQATWLGYFATTGLSEIDYVIADPHVAPPGEETHFTETVWRLPDIYYCFSPPASPVEVAPLPAETTGAVTFGCFNNLTKLNDAVIGVWARILQSVPGSRLILKAPQRRGHARDHARSLPRRRDRGGPASSGAAVLAGRLSKHLRPDRHRTRPVPLSRRHHQLRVALDGRPGPHPARRPVPVARRRDHPEQRGPSRVDRQRQPRLRRPSRPPRSRHPASRPPASPPARSGPRLPPVRRAALRQIMGERTDRDVAPP